MKQIIILGFLLSACKMPATRWSKPIALPKNISGSIITFDFTVDSKGTVHVVWDQDVNNDSLYYPDEIFYSQGNGSKWSEPVNISNTSTPSFCPHIVRDSRDHLYVIWGEKLNSTFPPDFPYASDIFYSAFDGNKWSSPISIYHDSKGVEAYYTKIETDNRNNIHIILERAGATKNLGYIYRDKNGWSLPQFISRGSSSDFFITSNNQLHWSYIAVSDSIHPSNNDVFYRCLDISNGELSDSILVHLSDGMDILSMESKIVVDFNGKIYIFWTESYNRDTWAEQILYSSSTDGILWTNPINLTNNPQNIILFAPGIVVDDRNNIHIVWSEAPNFNLRKAGVYYIYGNGTSWSKRETVYKVPSIVLQPGPKIAIDEFQNLHLIWRQIFTGGGDSLLYSTKSLTGIVSEKSEFNRHQPLNISPNPFKKFTVIALQLPGKEIINLKVYDATGRLVKTLLRAKGSEHRVERIKWDGRDNKGKILPPGVYFIRLETEGVIRTEKVILTG